MKSPISGVLQIPNLRPIELGPHNGTIGANPLPSIRNAPDLGTIANLGQFTEPSEQDKEELVPKLSIDVCQHCQDTLLSAFDHCLAKHGDFVPIDSTYEIDEENDGLIRTDAPLFDIIQDPTINMTKPIFENPKSIIERDKWVLSQKKIAAGKLDLGIQKPKVKGLGVKPGNKYFSGALYKRMLDAKEREITSLRQQLYETAQREASENQSVTKLKRALNKSVRYYTMAEEWQQYESVRLQNDIKKLKAEISTLIAYFINSEVQKQNLNLELNHIQQEIKKKEEIANEAVQQAAEMKLRLQESFKELIEMNSVVATLRKEAERGNDSVEARNIMLQKNLAKLSTDFETSTRELRAANSRMRELEYELEQMVGDLNVKGETLKKATASNIQLKTLLETAENELKDLTKTHEQLILQKAKVEADGRSEKLRSEQIIVDLKRNVSKLSTNLENTTHAKTDVETHLKVANAENNSLIESLKVQTEAKNELEVSLNRLKTSSKAEILSRDNKITNLTNENAKTIVLLKAAQEKKEQLTFKVTDLENNLDIEITNARVAKEELQKLKREYELKTNTLLEQVEKLTSLKNSLTLDKKDLNDKMKNLRIGLREKEDALAEVETALSNEKEAMLTLKAKFEEELSVLAKEHHQLKSEHEILNKRYELEVDENQKLSANKTSLESELAALQIDLLEARNKFQALTKDQDDLNKELQEWKALHSELMKKHELLTGTNRELAIEYANYKRYAEDLIQDRNIEVQEMAIKLDSVNAKIIAADDRVHNLQVELESTNQELETTQVKLNKQLTTTELLELHLDQTRKDYMYEKKMRRDIERVQMTLRYGDSTRAFDQLADWKARDRTLNQVCIGLKNESTRLVDLVELLPKEGGFGNETEFQWPAEFNLQAKKNKKK